MLVTSGAMAKPMDLVSAVSMTRKELTVDKQITRYSKVESWDAVYFALCNYAEEVVSRPYFFVPVGVWSRGGGNFVYSDEARLDSPSPFNQETVGRMRFLPRTDAIPGWFELRFTSYRNRKDGTGEWLREFEGFRDGALEEMERLGYELRAREPEVVEQNALLQTTGPERTKSRDDPNVFRQSGDMWEIAYTDGKGFHLHDLKGLHYIAYLLDNPGEDVSALDLEKSHPDSPDDTQAMQISAAQLVENGLATSSTDDYQPVLDKKAKQEYKDKLESLQDEREQAEQLGDEKRLERINKKTDAIRRELNSALSLYGKDRIFSTESERSRIRVTEAIKYAIGKLRASDKELAEHLGTAISTGKHCSYKPREEVFWNK